jgi:hypothetical protein
MAADVDGGERLESMSVQLSPYAADLLRVLTTRRQGDDPILQRPVDPSRLSDRELGVLLPAATRLTGQHPASLVRWGVEEAVRERQPVFTPESCAEMLAALVANLEAGTGGHPVLAVNALLRCDGPWSSEARRSAGTLARSLVARGRLDHPHALLALAELAGGLTRRLVSLPLGRRFGPLARDELKVLRAAGVPAQLLVAEVCSDRSYHSPPQLPEAWRRLAAVPEVASFARHALEIADQRVAEVQSGGQRYVADKAFAKDEVDTLGRAMRVALLHDEPWLPELLASLLPAVSVAPTAASTLPSQALLFEVARATGDFPTPEALAALRAARAVVRHKGVIKQLDRMLKRVERAMAERPGVAFRLPDLGFGQDGVRSVSVDSYQAVITVSDDVDLVWRRPDGKPSTTVPAAVRRDHADEVKALRDLVKQARGHRATLARALEAGYTAESSQPYHRWRGALASNGLGWSVASRLIWELQVGDDRWRAAIPADPGAFHDVAGAPVAVPHLDAQIRLWHPLRAPVEEIQAWRDLLTEGQVRQPFKQAFREIYLLTPAETQTETYSNRFAAHVVNYRQLYAVLRARGWTSGMLGPWDGGGTAEAYGVYAGGTWRAAFRHDHLERQPDGVECAGTDRVWFERLREGAWRTERLARVPAMVFSEAMRDVDLLIAVTSIAGDPHWVDRGEDDHYADYWRRASAGELSATAQVRRAALERLIPRTKIADRCTLTDRYLVVRGDLHTYKIHLGSANILMDRDDRYLCIVPSARKGPGQVFLPFEEDRLTLILSKAFLLADDARITDPSILAQLRSR